MTERDERLELDYLVLTEVHCAPLLTHAQALTGAQKNQIGGKKIAVCNVAVNVA
jgi:hypothetical protein